MRDGLRLIVMRHAKAGELPGGPDFERALRPRGQRDSEAAGRWLAASGLRPDAVICSAARRTRQTWQYVRAALRAADPAGADPAAASSAAAPDGEPQVFAEQRLYLAGWADVAGVIRETGAGVRTLLYIGHNPAAAELVSQLTGAETALRTAGIAVLGLPGDWAGLAAGDGELIASWQPPDES